MFNALLSHAPSINLWRLNLHTIIDPPTNKVIYIFCYRGMRAYRNNALRIASSHSAIEHKYEILIIPMKSPYQLLVHKRNLIL